MKLIIGVDIDNVCVNTAEAVLEWLAEMGAPKKTINDIKTYWIERNFPPEYDKLIKESFESKSMWKKVKLIDGTKEYLKRLYIDGHELYFCTSSLPQNLRKKIKHLTRSLGFLSPEYVDSHTINIHKKQLLNIDVLIDDCIENLTGDRSYISICYKYPWNENVVLSEVEKYRTYFANNWNEIYDIIYNKILYNKDNKIIV
jgi:5'(3')-deoxyribonucleotidase